MVVLLLIVSAHLSVSEPLNGRGRVQGIPSPVSGQCPRHAMAEAQKRSYVTTAIGSTPQTPSATFVGFTI